MGLFDSFGLKKKRKAKDEKIAQAQQLMKAGEFSEAQDILFDIAYDMDDDDFEYRVDELEYLCERCKIGIEEQKERKEQEKLAARDRIIEDIKAALKAKDWRKAIELLDEAMDKYDGIYSMADVEDMCIKAQEMCFDSDEINDWSDAVYSRLYMLKKERYIKLARKMVNENSIYMAKNTLYLLDSKYNSAYMDDEVEELWNMVMKGKDRQNDPLMIFRVPKRTDDTEETAENAEMQKKEKDRLMEQLNSCIDDGDWDKGIEILDKIEAECDRSYRAEEMESLCQICQEMQFESLEDIWDGRYADIYMRLKDEYIEKLGKLVADGKKDDALRLCVHINMNYCSPYKDEEFGRLWDAVMQNQNRARWEDRYMKNDETAVAQPTVAAEETEKYEENAEKAVAEILEETAVEDVTEEFAEDTEETVEEYETEADIADEAEEIAEEATEDAEYEEITAEADKEAEASEEIEAEEIAEEEPAEQPVEEIPAEIDGKDSKQWHIEALELYQSKKYTPALSCMEKAAKLGDATAMYNTAVMYNTGMGTAADEQKAFYWFEKSALAGDYKSMSKLAGYYWQGKIVEKDRTKAFCWSKKAAEEGNEAASWFALAHAYDNGDGAEKDAEKALYCLEKASQGGVKEAFIYCAQRYDSGNGVAVDKAKALYWYEKAAENGNDEAMMACYRGYHDAIGTDADYEKASHWLTEACKKGNIYGLYELGKMYVELGKDEDQIKNGYALLEQAAEKGHVDAMMRLADDYGKENKDSKVEEDREKALYWYEKAANGGDGRGMMFTFLYYYNGVGTAQDMDKASRWLWASIDAGEMGGAVYMSSSALRTAEDGKPEFYEKALYWAEIAAKGGHEASVKVLPSLHIHCLNYEMEKEQPDPAKIVEFFEKFILTNTYENMEQKGKAELLMIVTSKLLEVTEQYERSKAAEYGGYIIRYLEKAAEYGKTDAMTTLAAVYEHGFYTDRDKELSFGWRKKAYDSGDAESAFVLAKMYYSGFGCQQDYKKAFELCKAAAGNGDDKAYGMLGEMYYHGRGCQQDYEKSFEYYNISAAEGNMYSKESLLLMYASGEGCEQNTEKAFSIAKELAEEGSATGYYVLGMHYAEGICCDKDYRKAYDYLQKAAAQNDASAYYELARLHEYCLGCEWDLDKAFELYKKAAEGGVDIAVKKVAELIRTGEVTDRETERTRKIAEQYIASPDPEVSKAAEELLGR